MLRAVCMLRKTLEGSKVLSPADFEALLEQELRAKAEL